MKNLLTGFICFITLASFQTNNTNKLNGESIYTTGKNLQGEKMLNKAASRIKIVKSCKTCHGKNGDKMDGFL